MEIQPVGGSAANPAQGSANGVNEFEEARFRAMMNDGERMSQEEIQQAVANGTASRDMLWDAFYNGFTDFILRQGIKRSIDHMDKMERIKEGRY